MNTADFLTKDIGKKFLPVVISNRPSSVMKPICDNAGVVLLDFQIIMEILDFTLKNDLKGAKQILVDEFRRLLT